ncbi:hypothetical protein [Alkalicoccus luteus]|uniref:hypothetical protein n=1 Tax=Alkalicoccus luteus TaxID=1237094 RepID=UPI00403483F6
MRNQLSHYNPLHRTFWSKESHASRSYRVNKLLAWGRLQSRKQLNFDQYPNGGVAWVHPSVLHVPEKWNGYAYWMGINAYPQTDGSYENPYFFFSQDGVAWHSPAGMKQPLYEVLDHTVHNSDAELILVPDRSKMYYLNRAVLEGGGSRLELSESTDGISWTGPTTVFPGPFPDLLSPTVCEHEGFYYLFAPAVRWNEGEERAFQKLNVWRSCQLASGWEHVNSIATGPLGNIWHAEVRKTKDRFIVLALCGDLQGGTLQFGTFLNPYSTHMNRETYMVDRSLFNYKSSFVVNGNHLEVFAGFKGVGLGQDTLWRITRKTLKLGTVLKKL